MNLLVDQSVTIFVSMCLILTNDPICTSAATTTPANSLCPKCGIVGKSEKTSCCGRSGSWFGNCGSAGNVEVGHTWYEGIQACKTWARSKGSVGRRFNADQPRNSSDGGGLTKLKAPIASPNAFAFTSTHKSTSILVGTSHMSCQSTHPSTNQPPR